ncbi:hypothetical protein [Hypnocyclicus thermotrophus]|nr:hypothetical protein [Hypnocyclicus thermotrophus]
MSSKNYGYMHLVGGNIKVKDSDLRNQFSEILKKKITRYMF